MIPRCLQLRPAVVALLFLAWAPAAFSTAQSTDAASALFDDSTLHELRFRVNATDWDTLVANYDRNDYYPADLVWRGETLRNVGIRSRGSGSRNPNKLGLKVKFNRYVSGQQLLGLTEIVLDNLYTDDAMIRERVSMKLYERLGLPASRESFARVYVNDQYYGLYAIVESVDKRFLKRAGLDSDGYIYDYQWLDVWWFNELGEDLEPYEARFQPDTREDDPSEALFGTIRDFVHTTNQPHFIERDIGEFLDLRLFLRGLAVEAFLAEWDGLVGDFGINNFYLYRGATSKQFQFLPWDKDNTFKAVDYPVWPDGMNNNVLTSQLMNVDELRTFFLDAVLEAAASADSGRTDAGGGWLTQQIETQYSQIHEAALADGHKPQGNRRFEAAVDELRAFARDRGAFVRSAVAQKRR